jgi:lipopolysaccharide export system protein LptA
MLARIARSAITLATLVVVYQVYVLTVARVVEPPAVAKSGKTITKETRDVSYDAIGRYQALLAAYFPQGHWALVSPPKVIRLDKLMLVLKDYRRHDDGSVDLDQCAVLILPDEWEFGAPSPRETVILEAPGGAHLQFDEDFQPTRGKAGRIVEGRFPGEIVIRSDMKLPGPDDDLMIVTRDLSMNDHLIRSDAEVRARIGANKGGGRGLQIRLSRDNHIKRGPSINGVESLAVLSDVQLELESNGVDMFGEEKPQDRMVRVDQQGQQRVIRLATAEMPQPQFETPVVVKCQGRFHFDLMEYVASFEQQVEVRRQRLNGQFDSLDCNELAIQFSPVDAKGIPIANDDPDIARRQSKSLGKFKPIGITATGQPVKAYAPMQNAEARAGRIHINLYARRIRLDQMEEVVLRYGASEIHAPFIEYQMPPEKSPQAVGELSIAGPGWLRAVPDSERTDRIVDVAWKKAASTPFPVQLTRRNGQPILVLSGQPVIDAHRLGRIAAERMEVELVEVPPDGPDGPALEVAKGEDKLAIIPQRLLASGNVAFASPKLTGRTHQLEGAFQPWEPAPPASAGLVSDAAPANDGTAAPNGPLNMDPSSNDQTGSQYDLAANQIHLDLALSGKSAEPTAVTCDGSVVLREVRGAKPGEEPMEVRGNQLLVRDLQESAKITVIGRRDPQLGGPGTATINARGMTLAAERINADQKLGKFWINGPGMATMDVTGEAFGQPGGTMTPVSLTWQTGLDAAGTRVVASGRVLIESQHGWAQGDRAIALLNRPLSVDRDAAKTKIDVSQVSLEGNVVGDYVGRDENGQTSHENFQLKSIAYDRVTGNLQGSGPGVLRSVRWSDSSFGFEELGGAATQTPNAPKPPSKPELRFLRVDFEKGLSGNVNQRVVRFHQRVRSVYGPVADWQQELPLHAPDRLPVDTVTLACETLEVNEDPLGRPPAGSKTKVGPLEIRAIDNVEIEGRSEKNGTFQAQAVTASYSQAKDMFVLEGDGQQDAVIRTRDPATGRYSETPARSIAYWKTTGIVKLNDIQRPVDIQQFAPRNATPAATPPRTGPIR